MEITAQNVIALEDRFQKLFNTDYQVVLSKAWWDKLATMKTSQGRKEVYQFLLTTFGLDLLPKGEMIYNNMVTQAFEKENEDRGGAISLSRNQVEDDLFQFAADLAGQMGASIALAPQYLIVDLIKNGETNLGYDGVPFFSNSHPVNPAVSGSSTYDNLVTGAALSISTFAAGVAQMAGFLMPNGKNRNLTPSLLVCPPSLWKTAMEICQAKYISATENIFASNIGVDVLMVHELEDEPTSWYLMATAPNAGTALNPFIYQIRRPYEMTSYTGANTMELGKTNKLEWQIRGRDAAVYGHPFQAIKFKA